MRVKKRISRIAYHTVVLAVGFVMIYPLLWMVMSSFKESSTIFHTAGQLLPTQPTLENYANGWKGFSHTTFATFFKNTFFVAAMGTVGSIVSSLLVAYGLSRLRFRLRGLLLRWCFSP